MSMNKKAMYQLSYGLFILAAADADGKPNACITNTAIQVTSEPNQIAFAVNKANYTHDLLAASGVFTLSILSEEADFGLFEHFGFQTGREVDKFAEFTDCKAAENGLPYITRGVNSYISGKVVQKIDVGTHTLFVAEVTEMDVIGDAASATYTYYQNHIKPKPEAASDSGKKGEVVWRCVICGYIYEGDPLPDDFICPLCKHPASDFERIER